MSTRTSLDPRKPIGDGDEVVIEPDAIKVSELTRIAQRASTGELDSFPSAVQSVGSAAGDIVQKILQKFNDSLELTQCWAVLDPRQQIRSVVAEQPEEQFRTFRFLRPASWTPENIGIIICNSYPGRSTLLDLAEASPQPSIIDPSRTVGEAQVEKLLVWTAQRLGRQVITDDAVPRVYVVISDHVIENARTLANKGAKAAPSKAPDSSFPNAPKKRPHIIDVESEVLSGESSEVDDAKPETTRPHGLNPSLATLARGGVTFEVISHVIPPSDPDPGRGTHR